MKKLLFIFVAGIAVSATSCKKFLDINENPNLAVEVTPELVMPQAIVYTANTLNGFNNYGSQTGLYQANAGGYGGFGEFITYNYTTANTGIWGSSYDNLKDYQYVLTSTEGLEASSNFNAVARIMKAFHFQLLVDAFNSIPYTTALNGVEDLTPQYDDPKVIYKDLADELDKAIATINAATGVPGVAEMGASDPIFKGNMTLWKKFATTLKLRIILRAGSQVTFTNTTFPEGFLTTDVLINPGPDLSTTPGYTRDNGRQNPQWNQWAFSYTGATGNRAWMPSTFIFGFYDGHKLLDEVRGEATYYQFPNTGTNRLGYEDNDVESSPAGSFWYVSDARDGLSAGNAPGVLKGPNAGYPVMLAAESYFLQAEAQLKGLVAGDAETSFNAGMLASFNYILRVGASVADVPAAAAGVAQYKEDNDASYLVNYEMATTDAQRLEAIITQKFIANNFIRGEEGYNEYRRTKYPVVNPGGDGNETFASLVSESPRADKLPTRILYPISEGTTNGENVPTGISPFTSLIFWAQ
ncbi:MAG: SusD/RagB family nutrient-binding outer membrane lipoprotein [Chitinophagaceae bacterium]|nr:MAG: SusD/RagB family nutrient-binding outer membrane lipoprotein [Chitinophagaceae bacterium]